MMPRARFQWGALSIAIVVSVAGCAEKKFSEPAKEIVISRPPCEAALNAMEVMRSKGGSVDVMSGPPGPDDQSALLPAEILRLRRLLRREGPNCFEQRLAGIRAIESANRPKAVEEYESLSSFVVSLRTFGVEFSVIDLAAKVAELRKIDTDAEEAYVAADAAMQARRCQEAIPLYRRSLDLVADYKDAPQKIAECHYEMAGGATENRLYRQATQHYLTAEQYQPNYKDSRMRAARIHLALGNYYLAQGYPRNAVMEYQAANSMVSDFPGVRNQLEAAKAKAHERIAVVGISNRTGNAIEGMAVEEFIAHSIFEKLQQKKSQFLELYTETQLEPLLSELGVGLKGITDKTAAAELGKLRGVKYLLTGRITQVSQKKEGPVRTHRETSRQVGMRAQSVQYDEIAWSTEIAVAGSIEVLDVQTWRIVLLRDFDKRESRGGRWAENPSLPETQPQLSLEAQVLQQVTSPDAMAKQAMDGLTDELVSAILEKIDGVPVVPDPTAVLAELHEPRTPIGLTRPAVREETIQPAPKVEVALLQQRVKVKGDAVNIRLKPSTQSPTLARVRRGDVLSLVSKDKDWVKIRLSDGREGWIAERLVELLSE